MIFNFVEISRLISLKASLSVLHDPTLLLRFFPANVANPAIVTTLLSFETDNCTSD